MPLTLRHLAQSVLQRMGLLNRARHSWLYDAYWSVANPSLLRARDLEVAFYRQLLQDFARGGLIFDIGANHGYKTDIFLRLGAKVLSIDPDELNQRILRESFIAKRIKPKPVIIVDQALSDSVGTATLWVNSPGSALNTLDERWVESLREDETRFGTRSTFGGRREVETTTLDCLISRYGRPSFVKIDVEGHELAVLRGLSAPVAALSFEVNLPDFLDDAYACISHLLKLSAKGTFNYCADCKQGLVLRDWVGGESICAALKECREPSIEVHWKANGI